MDDDRLSSHFKILSFSDRLKMLGKDEKEKKDTANRSTERTVVNFDEIIGHIEDMLLDERFYKLQESFLVNHWTEFTNDEENKHSYMDIFINYTNALEDFLLNYLQSRVPHFIMEHFVSELKRRKDELDGEVFEILFTLTDFTAFKQMFLDYRQMKESGDLDLSSALSIVHLA